MSDEDKKIDITPETKVGPLLKAYPQLKEVLFDITPAFKKLSNPILLRTVAKVTSLKQAAQVGNVKLPELINRLRAEVGLKEINVVENKTGSPDKKPEWFNANDIFQTLDARPMIDKGEQPIGKVLGALKVMPSHKIYELITPFVPAPLIDKINKKEFAVYLIEEKPELIKTYFYKL